MSFPVDNNLPPSGNTTISPEIKNSLLRVSENKTFRINDMSSKRELHDIAARDTLSVITIAILAIASIAYIILGITLGTIGGAPFIGTVCTILIVVGSVALTTAILAGVRLGIKLNDEWEERTPSRASKILDIIPDLDRDIFLFEDRLSCWKNKFNEELTKDMRERCQITAETWKHPPKCRLTQAKFLIKLEEVFECAKFLSTEVFTDISQKPTVEKIEKENLKLERILKEL